ncbi:MAG: hypothetical protein QOD98_2793, partial [Nocardioidaceae bacterium]|nr:hypothetical protein [Nocardioidaceae bacterium]
MIRSFSRLVPPLKTTSPGVGKVFFTH